MRKSRFTEEQFALALRQVDAGVPIADLCRMLGISEPSESPPQVQLRLVPT